MNIKPPVMKRAAILVPVLILLLCAFFSGCTSEPAVVTPAPTVPTPVPTTVTVVTTTPLPLPTTERVQVLPPERQVDLALTKDRPTSEIHLLFQGGPGEIYTNRVTMRVYTSDTEYTEYIMSEGRKPIPGNEIIAPGTRGGDRCEVFVISAGTRYKVIDERVYAGMYY
jgi:hypothetical protein